MDPYLYQAASETSEVRQLYSLAVAPAQPTIFSRHLRIGLLIFAGLLIGTGVIFWVAANWQALSRLSRFMLIEGALLLSVLWACVARRGPITALFCGTLVLGGLLALVGQTYQTGADAWQLFAVWAGLSLIWVMASKSDLMWSLWVLIAASSIVLWAGRWEMADVLFVDPGTDREGLLNIALWLLLAIVPALVSQLPALRVGGGLAWWSHRIALTCALAVWSSMGAAQVLDIDDSFTVWVFAAVVILVAMSFVLSLRGRFQDFIVCCMSVFALNVIFLACVARILFNADEIGLLIFGFIALACLGGSVSLLMRLQRGSPDTDGSLASAQVLS